MINKTNEDLIIREDGLGKIMYNTEKHTVPPLKYILYTEYKYLYDSLMDNRPFIIDGVNPTLFKEIIFDNKVVGFSTYDFANPVWVLKYIYVLPEYRGNNLLMKDIKDTFVLFEKQGCKGVFIDMPNGFVIKSLIKNGVAKLFNNHLVLSHIPFSFTIKNKDEYSQDELKWFEDNGKNIEEIGDTIAVTQIYDMDIMACVSLELQLITAICDEDFKIKPNLVSDRMIDPVEYFDKFSKEINCLVEDGKIKR